MVPSITQTYVPRIEADLRRNILPFWLKHTRDRERGGFVGEISPAMHLRIDVERGSLLTSRILWTFAAAYREFGDEVYLEMARWAKQDLVEHFWDNEHGGVFWSITPDGKPLKTRKQIYGLAFALYALSEFNRATGDRDALDRAISLFRLIEKHAYDSKHGGYWEACSREWATLEDMRLSEIDRNDPKSQNTHLHIMEAYTNLLRAWPDAELRAAQSRLIGVMMDRILFPTTHHLGLFFDAQWKPTTDRISYGHDIEAAWLLTEAAEVVGDQDLLARVRKEAVAIAEATLPAIDDDGALLYEGTPERGVTVTLKEWWPQAEAAVGFINAYQLSGDKRFLETALRLWDFIEKYLVDHETGEWHRSVSRDRQVTPDQPKVSFWKCPYHNGRACLELITRLKALKI